MGKTNKSKNKQAIGKPTSEDVIKKDKPAVSKCVKDKRKDFKQKKKKPCQLISNNQQTHSIQNNSNKVPELETSGGSSKMVPYTPLQKQNGPINSSCDDARHINYDMFDNQSSYHRGGSYNGGVGGGSQGYFDNEQRIYEGVNYWKFGKYGYNARDGKGGHGENVQSGNWGGRGKRGFGLNGGFEGGRGGYNYGGSYTKDSERQGGYVGGVGDYCGRGGYGDQGSYGHQKYGESNSRNLVNNRGGRSGFKNKVSDNVTNNSLKDLNERINQERNKNPKRPTPQSIEEVKKIAKKKKEKAMEVAKELEEKSEIAVKAAKIKAALGSINSSVIFSPQRSSQDLQQSHSEERVMCVPRVKIDKKMVPDLVLSASEIAEVGRGRRLTDPDVEDTCDISEDTTVAPRPSVLPAFHDDLVVPPPSNTINSSESQPLPRVAYTPWMFPHHQPRKRTFSESSCLQEPVLKRVNIQSRRSSQSTGGQCMDEAMGQMMDKQRVETLKKSLLKMNKKSLSELVNKPTSSKSRLLMGALVKDHRSFLSNCLNRARFCRVEQDEDGRETVNLDEELDCLPNNLMIEISDIIKQEVPAIEIIIDEAEDYSGRNVKQEPCEEFGPIDLNLKCEVVYGEEEVHTRRDMNTDSGEEGPVTPRTEPAGRIQANNASIPERSEASTSNVYEPTNSIDKATKLAPVYKKRGRPCNGRGRRIGGHEVVIGTIGDLVNVQGYENSETDNDDHEEIEIDKSLREVGNKDASNKMKSLGLIFEQEASILSTLEEVDTKMSSLAQERSSLVQQLLFLSELKKQMFKD